MVSVNDFFHEEKDCIYKEEYYSVRDNGAVMRHAREGKRIRKDDNVWTFGKPNDKTGYMEIAGQRVHRIVAVAFHGNPPTEQHVVDHIDTNRRNNRPENLRWVTRLENALNNPITRAKIENICGSIEVFLANPSVLRGHEDIDSNFTWMRAVSPEEANASLMRLTLWAKEHPKPQGGSLGEWIFQERKTADVSYYTIQNQQSKPIEEPVFVPQETKSITSNAIQLNWKNPVEFPCCPQQATDKPLETYLSNLKEGKVFSKNNYGESTVLKFGITNSDNLWVMCNVSIGWKTHAITRITFKDAIFYHENMGVYDIGDEPEDLFISILNGELKPD
ncbi:MAG: HNH endonuclease signature motif containing protein [Prevotellaceae bacterium]|nr:HNH endonuclease signature motif containing protein [Prevotellaceae bacterium]